MKVLRKKTPHFTNPFPARGYWPSHGGATPEKNAFVVAIIICVFIVNRDVSFADIGPGAIRRPGAIWALSPNPAK